MRYQNYRGDFLIVEKFYRDGNKQEPIPVPGHVRVNYFTGMREGVFVAERDGDRCRSCKVSDDGMSLLVYVPLSRVPIGQGELLKVVTEISEDVNFPSGKKYVPVPQKTGIILYNGMSDGSGEVVSESVLSLVLHGYSAYELAVQHGYEGTEEEWLESLKANLAYQDGKAAVCITEIPAVEIRTPEGMPAVHIDNDTFALTRSDGMNALLVSSVSNKVLNIGNAEDAMTLRSLGGNVSIEDASGAKKSIIHEGNIDEYIEAPSPMAFPVFDILTTRSRRDKYKSSNTYNGENWELYDYYPCLRFVGPAPSDPYRWSFLIYFYSHKKNKKYKLLFEVPLSECEMPEGWSNNAYQTVVLPVSLMRLFWDLFDPTATGTNKFHGAAYIPATIASEWMSVCATGKSISKRSCSVGVTPRAHGAYYSGSFGIRLISVPGQIYGEMHKFKISLFNHPVSILSEHSNILRFSIKMHSGNVTQTLR